MPLPYISIDNFRAFKEKCEFEFAPVTILTGTNSSGKSSLVDALRILQSYTNEIPDPDSKKFWDKIINLKDSHFHKRIPDFKALVNNRTGKESINFEFKCKFVGMREEVILCFEYKQKNGKGVNGILKSLQYKNVEEHVFFNMEINDDNVTHLEIDFGFLYQKFQEEIQEEIEYYDTILNDYISNSLPENVAEKIIRQSFLNPFKIHENVFNPTKEEINEYEKIKENFKKIQPSITSDEINENSKNELSEQDKIKLEELNAKIIEAKAELLELQQKKFEQRFKKILNEKLSIDEFLMKFFKQDDFLEIFDKNTLSLFGDLFLNEFMYNNICNSIVGMKEKLSFNYISSIRNSPDRFYRKEGEDSFGSLLSEFLEKDPQTNEQIKEFLNRYLRYFDIGEEIRIERNADAAFNIHAYRQGQRINLVDLGFGISQIMPILLQILLTAFDSNTSSIIIEEPETNLHPALQSKLADMVIDANKVFGIQFIIETHSEYLIRRLQGLVANKKIDSKKISMYYFNHPDNIPEGEPQVYQVKIEEDGALSKNFGKGFYDEAANLNIALYNYSKEQHN